MISVSAIIKIIHNVKDGSTIRNKLAYLMIVNINNRVFLFIQK